MSGLTDMVEDYDGFSSYAEKLDVNEFIRYVSDNVNLSNVDLRSLVINNAKEGITLSEKRLNDYGLSLINVEPGFKKGPTENWRLENTKSYPIYMDAPVGIALMYKNVPNACVSFAKVADDTLRINQIQGVVPVYFDGELSIEVKCGCSRGLMPLNWLNLMVEIVEEIASDLSFNNLEILSIYNNVWYNVGCLGLLKGYRRYDKIAEARNYQQKEDKNWVLEL